jgi:hypothetical protein
MYRHGLNNVYIGAHPYRFRVLIEVAKFSGEEREPDGGNANGFAVVVSANCELAAAADPLGVRGDTR